MLYSSTYGIDPIIVLAVMEEESQYDIHAVGEAGEIGLLQLLPSSFPGYTKKQLFNPQINVKLGIRYLAKLQIDCVHKGLESVVCFNMGPSRGNRVKHPTKYPYYKRVVAHYNKLKQ
jgi:soluble lytic murein transglycosylase-like protein